MRIGLEAGIAHVRLEHYLKSTPDIEVVLNCNYSHRVIFHEMVEERTVCTSYIRVGVRPSGVGVLWIELPGRVGLFMAGSDFRWGVFGFDGFTIASSGVGDCQCGDLSWRGAVVEYASLLVRGDREMEFLGHLDGGFRHCGKEVRGLWAHCVEIDARALGHHRWHVCLAVFHEIARDLLRWPKWLRV